MKSIKKIVFILSILLGSGISCTVVDTELMELVLEIKNQNEELLTEVKSLQTKSDSLVNEIKKSAAKQEELLKKVTELQTELAKVLSQITSLNEKLTSQGADLDAIKAQLADLQKKYEGILIQLEQLQKLSQILAEIEKLKGQLSDLDEKYQVVVNTLAQNQQALDALKSQVTALQSQLAQNLEKISQLTSQLGEQGADIEKILTQIEELKVNCAEIKKLLENQLSGKSPIPTNGLVAWYPFNGNANDESGNGNNGTPGNGITLTTDRNSENSSAYNFTGIGSINLSKLPTSGNESFTISAWILSNTTNSRRGIICWGQDTPWASTYFFINSNGKIQFDFAYNDGPFSSVVVNDNKWHFVTITNSNGLIKVYVDGIQSGDQLQMFPNIQGNNKAIGSNITNTGSNLFIGKLDDIAIWNRALTADEVSKIYKGEGF